MSLLADPRVKPLMKNFFEIASGKRFTMTGAKEPLAALEHQLQAK